MEVTATHRLLRSSPRKVRLLLANIRGQQAEHAVASLRLAPQAAAVPLRKVIASAMASAENNYSLARGSLVIERATADQGPTYKRFVPKGRGRAGTIRRPTTHVTVVLKDVAGIAPKKPRKFPKPIRRKATAKPKEPQSAPPKDAPKGGAPKVPTPGRGNEAQPQGITPRRTEQQTGRDATTRRQGDK